MIDKLKHHPILVGGLRASGKTAFICALLHCAKKYDLNTAAFKPFDIGILQRNAAERSGDGELFCRHMSGEPMETLISPYISNEHYPIEMSFRRDGIYIDENFLLERLRVLDQHYDRTFIELPGGLYSPLTEDKNTVEWMSGVSKKIIWIIHPSINDFEHNLAEIALLKEIGIDFHLVINNRSQIMDQDLLFYIWEKVEDFSGQQVEGMIPYSEDPDEQFAAVSENVCQHLPGLLDKLFKAD